MVVYFFCICALVGGVVSYRRRCGSKNNKSVLCCPIALHRVEISAANPNHHPLLNMCCSTNLLLLL